MHTGTAEGLLSGAPVGPPAKTAVPGLLRAAFLAFLLSNPLETLFYFKSDDQPDSTISITRILGVALFAVAALRPRTAFRRWPAEFWLLAGYLAAFSLSQLIVPPSLDAGFSQLQSTLLQSAALFLVSYNLLLDPELRTRALRMYGWWSVLIAVLVMLGVAGGESLEEAREAIDVQDPNVTAWLFVLGALCLAGDPELLRPLRRPAFTLLSAAGMGVLLTGVLRTGSRGGLLSFGAGALGLAVCGTGSARFARAGAALAAAGLLGLLIRREFKLQTDTSARLERAWNEGDTAGRTDIYATAWQMVRERPLLGWGAAANRDQLGARLNYANRDTHNIALAALTEVGWLGSAPFFAALLLAAAGAWRAGARNGDSLPFALLCATLVMGASVTASRQKLFWVVLATAAASGGRP
jgi:O-antigen ligase